MRLVRLVFGGATALILIALAVANRDLITLSFDPFSAESPFFALQMPLFLVLFAGLIVGFAAGAAMTWMAERPRRRAARQSRKVIEKMERAQTGPAQTTESGSKSLLAVGQTD